MADPMPAANPMHQRDRILYLVIAWSAIPAAMLIAGVVALSSGLPHWGSGLIAGGALGMTGATLHVLDRRPPLRAPSRLVISLAILTWAFVGWQAWQTFRSPPPTADEIAVAVVSKLPKIAEPQTPPLAPAAPAPVYLANATIRDAEHESVIITGQIADDLQGTVDVYAESWGGRYKLGSITGTTNEQRTIVIAQSGLSDIPSVKSVFWGDPSNRNVFPNVPSGIISVPACIILKGALGEQKIPALLARIVYGNSPERPVVTLGSQSGSPCR
jgi:hypothetical protein